MKEVVFYGRQAVPPAFQIGVEMDNGVEQIQFVLPQIVTGQGATLYIQNGDYADAIVLLDGIWNVEHVTTQHVGEYTCYVTISNGEDVLWHSETFTASVYDLPDTEGEIGQQYPTAIQQAMDAANKAVAAAGDAQGAVEEAAAAAARASASAVAAAGAATEAIEAKDEAARIAQEAKEMQEMITDIEFSINADMELEVEVGWQV